MIDAAHLLLAVGRFRDARDATRVVVVEEETLAVCARIETGGSRATAASSSCDVDDPFTRSHQKIIQLLD